MSEKYTFEFQFKGENFDAEILHPKEIAELIITLTEMITAIVSVTYPRLMTEVDESNIVLGLSSVTQGSLIPKFVTTYEKEVGAAVEMAASAIMTETYDALPVPAIEALKKVRSFNKHHKTYTEFWKRNGQLTKLATITPQTRIDFNASVLKGTTTLYGKLIRIGGDDPPRAVIHFINGQKLSCRVRSQGLAQRMAQHLYERIGVTGVAEWYVRDMSLREFRITDLLPYKQANLKDALKSLGEIVRPSYETIGDIAANIAEIRGKDENE